MVDIKDTMKKHLGVVKLDKSFLIKLQQYRIGWINKGKDYIDFIGSNLVGVHNIKFSEDDEDILFLDILKVDKNLLRTDIFNTPGINKNWKVSSDEYYVSIIYLVHLAIIDKTIDDELRTKIIKELYFLMAYKIIGSIYSHYFEHYKVDVAIAKGVVESLNESYLIKSKGSWQGVFEYRAKDLLKDGLWYKRLAKLDTKTMINAINDIQGRIRGLVKYIYDTINEVKELNKSIKSSNLIETSAEEGDSIKAMTNRPDQYINYIRSIFNKYPEFVNEDLVGVIVDIVGNVDEDKLVTTLKYISNNVNCKPGDKNDIIENILTLSFEYLKSKNISNDYHKRILESLYLMKGYWKSSSVRSTKVLETKEYLFKLAKTATGKKTPHLISSIVISTMLYIYLRSMYKPH